MISALSECSDCAAHPLWAKAVSSTIEVTQQQTMALPFVLRVHCFAVSIQVEHLNSMLRLVNQRKTTT
jgi:hypothetical protein